MQAHPQTVDLKALPEAHRKLFEQQSETLKREQSDNEELRAQVELLTDANRRMEHLAARGKSPSSISPINCKIRRQGNAWNSAWQSVSDQRDGKRNCLWQRVRFAA